MKNYFLWSGGSPSLIAIGRFASLGFSLVSIPIIARALGPDGRGVTAAMLAAITIATVALGLGVPLALRRRVAAGQDQAKIVAGGRLFALGTALFSIPLSVILDLLLYRRESFDSQLAFIVSVALIPFSISWAQDVSVLVATRRFTKMAILGVLQAATALVLTATLSVLDALSIAGVLYASLIGNIATFILGLAWVRAGIGERRVALEVTREGATLIGAQLADVGSKRVDQIIALPLLGAYGAGLYSVAATIALLAAPLAQSISSGMYSQMVEGSADAAKISIRYPLVLGFFASLALVGVSIFGIPLLFGPDFVGAILPAIFLSLGACFAVPSYTITIWLSAQRRGPEATFVQIFALIVLVLLFSIGAFTGGLLGAVVGVVMTSIIGFVLLATRVTKNAWSWFPQPQDVPGAFRAFLSGR